MRAARVEGASQALFPESRLTPWSRPLDVDRLADAGGDVEFVVPLGELPGLRSLREGVTGEASGSARFTRTQSVAVAQLRFAGTATLQCQRCMQPLALPVDRDVRVALVASEADAARVPEDLEPMLAPAGRISIGELITEELLLALPIVPLHAGSEGCAPLPAELAPGEHAGETHKPFERLAELLKR